MKLEKDILSQINNQVRAIEKAEITILDLIKINKAYLMSLYSTIELFEADEIGWNHRDAETLCQLFAFVRVFNKELNNSAEDKLNYLFGDNE